MDWKQLPIKGELLPDEGVWSHELMFWGGDLAGLMTRIDYIRSLGADVLYLNPIFEAKTTHKYDTHNYFKIAPEFGNREDVKSLADELHTRRMKFVLDGVFNHMGAGSSRFREALADPDSPQRDWFYFGDQYPNGYRSWFDLPSLPELNLENPQVRAVLFNDPDSVVQSYLRDGVDGWRLDVAQDLGFAVVDEITRAAHRAKPGSWVIGEVMLYPDQWLRSMDGIINFTLRELIYALVQGKVSGHQAGVMIERMVEDSGIEPLMRSWVILDNHDTDRLMTTLPDTRQRRVAQVLQFTLPGAPVIYYGTEVGMVGKEYVDNRAPMRWDLVEDEIEELVWMKRLTAMFSATAKLAWSPDFCTQTCRRNQWVCSSR